MFLVLVSFVSLMHLRRRKCGEFDFFGVLQGERDITLLIYTIKSCWVLCIGLLRTNTEKIGLLVPFFFPQT